MKVWMDADVEVLSLQATENGNDDAESYDEIRVDENGNLWALNGSGSGDFPGIFK